MKHHTPYLHLSDPVGGREHDWWRGAVLYQIYPRSFQDSNGDGIGDLPGIIERLDYIASLGVDGIWVSPFFKSPQKDYGYDVSDYRDVDPLFGTLEDADRLIEAVHARGLKLLFDFVPSHTSDRHPWFVESRRSQDNPKADWYVWADARADGSPPNNWLSVFGGPAWTWDQRRKQYYCHHFLKEQPALNLWNPEAVAALLAEARFWFERGIDGFRVDAVDWALADRELRPNPPREHGTTIGGTAPDSPFGMQFHIYDHARPELGECLLKPFWHLSAEFQHGILLGEISGDTALLRAGEYTRGGGLDMVYTFDLLSTPFEPAAIRDVVADHEEAIEDGWMCWSFGNHDVMRAATRFGGTDCPEELRRLIPGLLCALKGTVCIYQGEELGLGEAELALEDIRDPFGLPFWPEFKGRDGCRTPMPWQADAPQAGFSSAKPWLPVAPPHRLRAVDRQEADPRSVLNEFRRFLAWRKTQPVLVEGEISFLPSRGHVLAFERRLGDDALICVCNMAAEPATWAADPAVIEPAGFASQGCSFRGRSIDLPGYGMAFAKAGM